MSVWSLLRRLLFTIVIACRWSLCPNLHDLPSAFRCSHYDSLFFVFHSLTSLLSYLFPHKIRSMWTWIFHAHIDVRQLDRNRPFSWFSIIPCDQISCSRCLSLSLAVSYRITTRDPLDITSCCQFSQPLIPCIIIFSMFFLLGAVNTVSTIFASFALGIVICCTGSIDCFFLRLFTHFLFGASPLFTRLNNSFTFFSFQCTIFASTSVNHTPFLLLRIYLSSSLVFSFFQSPPFWTSLLLPLCFVFTTLLSPCSISGPEVRVSGTEALWRHSSSFTLVLCSRASSEHTIYLVSISFTYSRFLILIILIPFLFLFDRWLLCLSSRSFFVVHRSLNTLLDLLSLSAHLIIHRHSGVIYVSQLLRWQFLKGWGWGWVRIFE